MMDDNTKSNEPSSRPLSKQEKSGGAEGPKTGEKKKPPAACKKRKKETIDAKKEADANDDDDVEEEEEEDPLEFLEGVETVRIDFSELDDGCLEMDANWADPDDPKCVRYTACSTRRWCR